MSLLSRSNISSCSFLPLCVEKPLFTDASIVPRSRGVLFFGACFCSLPPEPHETGTIRKHWNRATIYAETKRVHEQHSDAGMRTKKLQNVRTPSPRGYQPTKLVFIFFPNHLCYSRIISCLQPSWTVGRLF